MGDIREVHAASGNIGGEEDGGSRVAEHVRSLGSLVLGELRLDREGRDPHQVVAPPLEAELAAELNERGGVEVDNGLERLQASILSGLGGFAVDELEQTGEDVAPRGNGHDVLRHSVVGKRLVFGNGLHEFEVLRSDHGACQADDIVGDGGGDQHGLANLFILVREATRDISQLLLEADVQHTVGLVEHESSQVRGLNAAGRVLQQIVEATRGGNHEVAALALRLAEHGTLVGSSDGRLNDKSGVSHEALGFSGDLFGEFASRGQDDASNVVGARGTHRSSRGQRRIFFNHALEHRQEEGKRFTGTGLGLSYTAAVVSRGRQVDSWGNSYMSVPLRAGLMVFACTGVMSSYPISSTMALSKLSWTPSCLRSEN